MKRTIFLLFILSWFCTSCNGTTHYLSQRILGTETNIARVACIGDGITLGQDLDNRLWNSYPAQLQRLLGNSWHVKNFGVPGATILEQGTTPYRQQNAYNEALTYNPDIVIIALGSADIDPKLWKYKDYFRSNLNEIIDDFRALRSNPAIFLCHPPPSYSLDWRDSSPNKRLTKDLIPQIDLVAKETGIPVIDLFQILKDKPELFHGSLYPNRLGARLIAATVYSSIAHSNFLAASGE